MPDDRKPYEMSERLDWVGTAQDGVRDAWSAASTVKKPGAWSPGAPD